MAALLRLSAESCGAAGLLTVELHLTHIVRHFADVLRKVGRSLVELLCKATHLRMLIRQRTVLALSNGLLVTLVTVLWLLLHSVAHVILTWVAT